VKREKVIETREIVKCNELFLHLALDAEVRDFFKVWRVMFCMDLDVGQHYTKRYYRSNRGWNEMDLEMGKRATTIGLSFVRPTT
jgi:hypothetical protein